MPRAKEEITNKIPEKLCELIFGLTKFVEQSENEYIDLKKGGNK